MTKMAAQNENKRVFSPGNVDHQIADLALAFHLAALSLNLAKRLHFELESLSWRLARSQAAWYHTENWLLE